MPESIKNFLRTFFTHLFTGVDNTTFDLTRVMWFCVVVWAPALATWDVIINKVAFNVQTFGMGMAAILAGGGTAVAINRAGEPGAHK